MINNLDKIKGYVGLARKSDAVVIGAENLSNVKKKLFLILYSESAGKHLLKIVENVSKITDACKMLFSDNELQMITGLYNCKVIGIKNKGLADAIINIRNKE